MIRITITAAAFEAIAALPFGSAVVERDPDAKGEHQIWLAGGRGSAQGSTPSRREPQRRDPADGESVRRMKAAILRLDHRFKVIAPTSIKLVSFESTA